MGPSLGRYAKKQLMLVVYLQVYLLSKQREMVRQPTLEQVTQNQEIHTSV